MYTSKKIKDFSKDVDNVEIVMNYNEAIIKMQHALDRIDMADEDEEIEIRQWRELHQNYVEQAHTSFLKMTKKDISFCANNVVQEIESDGGDRVVSIRSK